MLGVWKIKQGSLGRYERMDEMNSLAVENPRSYATPVSVQRGVDVRNLRASDSCSHSFQ